MAIGTLPPVPTVLVTGATDGIGRRTALDLAERGARVIVHGRGAERAARVHAELARTPSGAAHPAPVVADFAALSSVRRMAAELAARGEAIHVVLNNAGVFMNERHATVDGLETTMAVNHFAPFVLTLELLAGPLGAGVRRVVVVSSEAHASGRIDPDEAAAKKRLFRRFDGYAAYSASKLANVLFTVELARRLGEAGPTVNALHPGVVTTKLLTEGFAMSGPDSLAEGARTSVFLALDASVERTTGRYFVRSRVARAHPDAGSADVCCRFFERSESATGTKLRFVSP
jgi:NAD(P)-dependent dehydrogenase (short-subunit alcohol dehydrogenase family)